MPLNYGGYTPQNPLPGLMQAYQFGSMLGADRNAKLLAQQQAAAEAERQARINAAFDAVHKNPTAANYAALSNILPPEMGKSVRESFTMLDKDKQQAVLDESARVFAAFKSGSPSVAIDTMKQKLQAYINSGDTAAAKNLQTWIDIAEQGPAGEKLAEDFFGFVIAQMPGGTTAIDGIAKFAEERRNTEAHPVLMEQKRTELAKAKSESEIKAIEAKYADRVAIAELKQMGSTLGLTDAQINKVLAETRKLDAETRKILMELEGLGKGNLSPEKVWEYETSLRKEYTQRTKSFDVARQQFQTIETSAADNSGAGDVALVFGFMRMLDPDSVVRESEFATARDTTGLLGQLQVAYDSLRRGAKLEPRQRQDFIRLAKQYWDAAQKTEEKHRRDLDIVVRNYGLNPANVFGQVAGPQRPRVEEVDF